MSLSSGAYFGSHSGVSQGARSASAARVALALVNRAVIENKRGRLARCRRFGAMDFIKPLQQGDDIGEEVLRTGPGATPSSSRAARQRGAALGERGFDNELARDEVHSAHHRDFLQLAWSFDPQVCAPLCPGTGEIGRTLYSIGLHAKRDKQAGRGARVGQRFRFIGKKPHNVARFGLLFHQLQPQARAFHGRRILAAFQSVAGPLAGKAPFLRSTTERREREMRCPVRCSISSDRRGRSS